MLMEPHQRKGSTGWYYDYPDASGKRRFATAPDKTTALLIQSKRQQEFALLSANVVTRQQIDQAKRVGQSIDVSITAYREHMTAKRCSAPHIQNTISSIERFIEWMGGITTAADITQEKLETTLNRRMELGMGHRTRNWYVKALKAFLQLMEDRDVIAKNPLRKMKAISEDEDTRRESEAMTLEVFSRLHAAVPDEERKLLYLFQSRTGMRWRESARLTWADLDSVGWWMVLPSRKTKAKAGAELPIPSDLVAALEAWRLKHPFAQPTDRLFPNGAPTLKTWQGDLVRAGICHWTDAKGKPLTKSVIVDKKKTRVPVARPGKGVKGAILAGYVTPEGRQYDRKCLRLTFGTWLYEAGVDLRDAQRLMRHADINLTAKIYTQIRGANLKAAAEKGANARGPAESVQAKAG